MKSLTKAEREEVRQMFGGRCAYCGVVLPAKWHADHVQPVVRGGGWVRVNEPHRTHRYVQDGTCQHPERHSRDNFFPCCVACNINKGACELEEWRAFLERLPFGIRRDHASFRHAERFGLVQVVTKPIVFYFERHAKDTHATH